MTLSRLAVALAFVPILLVGQDDVTSPRPIYKVEPEYSPEARAAHIQGTVVLEMVIDESGRPTNIAVLSPLGFGLDEMAEKALAGWQFAPGYKAGKPVAVPAMVEVSFRRPEDYFNDKNEHQRTEYNLAVRTLARKDTKPDKAAKALETVRKLAKKSYVPAMYALGRWELTGENNVEKNTSDGLALLENAAGKHHGPAIYEIALRHIEGRDLPKNEEKGLEEMRRASVLGSEQAQFYLGHRYQNGTGVEKDAERARRYFRLCAARGNAMCQYRLGLMLLTAEKTYPQAIAWIQLADEGKLADARTVLDRETPKLTPQQTKSINELKPQLVRK